jgi:hypothetical protein
MKVLVKMRRLSSDRRVVAPAITTGRESDRRMESSQGEEHEGPVITEFTSVMYGLIINTSEAGYIAMVHSSGYISSGTFERYILTGC